MSGQAVSTGLVLAPLMVLGSMAGKRVVDRLPERFFVVVIETTLVVAGVLFLVRG